MFGLDLVSWMCSKSSPDDCGMDSNVADRQRTFLVLTLKLNIDEKTAPPELM